MGGQRILVVEDYRPMLVAIQSLLEAEGYAVYIATNGVEALQVMEESPPDLILADIQMPEMDGYALYEAVCARPEWDRISFIVLTATADEGKVQKMGAEGYIIKPFEAEDLLQVVQSQLTL